MDWENEYFILSGKSDNFTIKVDEPLVTKNITLKPNPTDESGILDLNINVTGSGISSAKAIIKLSENVTAYISGNAAEGIINFQTGEITEDELADGLSNGSHPATFEFYTRINCSGEKVYSFTETINIFANLTTNTWVQNGNDPWFDTIINANGTKTTNCRVTAAMVEGFKLTEIFVDPSRTTDNPQDASYTTQSGTFLNPKVTFNDALAMLQNASIDYTIYINGVLRGPHTIPADLSKTAGDGKPYHAHSLTICGARGLNGYGEPQDGIKGYAAELENHDYDFRLISNYTALGEAGKTGSALKVSTDVPVILKDLKLCDSVVKQAGAGLYIDAAADVTIENGVLITGNKTQNFGGGVAVFGKLTMHGGKISSNTTYHSSGNSGGGGVVLRATGIFEMYDGEICDNLSFAYGGGVYIGNGDDNCSFVMHGGKICRNRTEGEIYDSSPIISTGFGGGVILSGGSFEMTGGEISANYSKDNVGGVAVQGNEFIMTGGKIENNRSDGSCGGISIAYNSTFKLGSDAYIPNNAGKKHYIGLSSNSETHAKITLISSLNRHSETDQIQITPSVYDLTTTVLDAANGVTLANEVGKFAVTQTSDPDDNWFVNDSGKLENSNLTFTVSAGASEDMTLGEATVSINGVNKTAYKLVVNGMNRIKVDVAGGVGPFTLGGSNHYGEYLSLSELSNGSFYISPKSTVVKDGVASTGYTYEIYVTDSSATPKVKSLYVQISYASTTLEDNSSTIYHGSKTPGTAKAVGDIVFNDGSAMPYYTGIPLTDEQKRASIALIYYTGTGLNNGVDTTIRTLGVGLKHGTNVAWCLEDAQAYNNRISSIESEVRENGDIMTSVKNGIENLGFIGNELPSHGIQPTDVDTGQEEKYPAFYFGINYKNQTIGAETTSRIRGTSFENYWYLPTIAELFQIYKNGKGPDRVFDIDEASQALGGGVFGTSYYWSSSQSPTDQKAYIYNFGSGNCEEYLKSSEARTFAIREF